MNAMLRGKRCVDRLGKVSRTGYFLVTNGDIHGFTW